MKIQIRKGIFESNSSSSHCICVMKDKQYFTTQEIRNEFYLDEEWCKHPNVLNLYFYGENYFGRGFRVMSSFRDKVGYAIASFCGNCYRLKSYIESYEKFENIIIPLLYELVNVEEVEVDMETQYFNVYSDSVTDDLEQDYSTYEEVPYSDLIYDENSLGCYKEISKSGRKQEKIGLEVPQFGGIDHQSANLLQCFLEKNNMDLKEFLLRKDIVVIEDSDETCIFSTMIGAGLINADGIEQVYPSKFINLKGSYEDKRNEETD